MSLNDICHNIIYCDIIIHAVILYIMGASQVAQWVKNLPEMQEMQADAVWSLGKKDLLEEGIAMHSSILAWRNPWTEEPGGLQSIGFARVAYCWSDWVGVHIRYYCILYIVGILLYVIIWHTKYYTIRQLWKMERVRQVD